VEWWNGGTVRKNGTVERCDLGKEEKGKDKKFEMNQIRTDEKTKYSKS
jgi:hypothetical protein